MSSWLIEDPTPAYLILGALGLGLGILWWMNRRGAYLIGLGAAALLIGILVLLNYTIDTDSKQIHRKLQTMADSVATRDVEAIFANISSQFRLGSMDRQQFQQRVESHLHRGDVQNLKIWDYVPREISREHRTATVTFTVKGSGAGTSGTEFYNCRASFVLDPDEQWRLKGFALFLPQVDPMTGQAIELPF